MTSPSKIALIGTDSGERVVLLEPDGIVDLESVAVEAGASEARDMALFADVVSFLSGGRSAQERAAELAIFARERGLLKPLDEKSLCAPFSAGSKLVCIAGNYRSHLEETKQQAVDTSSDVPKFFLKPRSAVVGPFADIKHDATLVRELDYEGEIGIVIGARATAIAAADVDEVVVGYMAVNDVTARSLHLPDQSSRGSWAAFFDWLAGKSFDTFAPMGPAIRLAPLHEIEKRRLETHVNGEIRQAGCIRDLIFGVRDIVAWLSTVMTLEPGDVIATGTPGGVGKARGQWLQMGDVVNIDVEGVGRLSNRVVEA